MHVFEITAVSVLDADKLPDKYPQLRDFDFGIMRKYVRMLYSDALPVNEYKRFIRMENPIYERVGYVVIDSIERLLELSKALDRPLLIENNTIEIYDGYRE